MAALPSASAARHLVAGLVLAVAAVLLPAAPAHAEGPQIAVAPSVGDKTTLFHGTASGFAAGAVVSVDVTVDGQPYTGSYTHTHTADATGAFTWAWRWTSGDPLGTYTLTFTDSATAASAGVALIVQRDPVDPPAPAAGTQLMVDLASAPDATTMAAWQQSSPYRAIGVYLPVNPLVDDRHDKVQANLTPDWVAAVRADGWQVLPIYLGLQAPPACLRGSFHAMSADPATAQVQGVAAAEDAARAATALGLPANVPIVDDLEGYGAGCSTQVQAFLLGWTTRLHELGRTAAVYGTASSVAADLLAAAGQPGYVEPDAIWLVTTDGTADTAIPGLPATAWHGRRANQFAIGVDRSYGGLELNVDDSAVDDAWWSLTPPAKRPDTTAPVVAMGTAPRVLAQRAHGQATFHWAAVDDASGVASYEYRLRHARGGHRLGAWSAASPAAAAQVTIPVDRGRQWCVQARATDRAGNVSGWSSQACTSRPAKAPRHPVRRLRLGRVVRGVSLGVQFRKPGAFVVRIGHHRVGRIAGHGLVWLSLPRRTGVVTLTATHKVAVSGYVLTAPAR
jgi:hypothetical protein